MGLLQKKASELTAKDRASLYKAVGTSALPYPSTHHILNEEGALDMEIGIIADDKNPLAIYSDQPAEHVIGLLYREMAIPSLLHVQEKAILNRAPDSRKRVMAILGDPGSGKSHLAKLMARMRDPRGAIVIDCGGRYLNDLIWEQVIDYGEDFKTALTDKICAGKISVPSRKMLEDQYGHALEKDQAGNITGIQWDEIAKPIEISNDPENPKYESSTQAVDRALGLMRTIAAYEGIPAQTVNTIGVKKQHGALMRAAQEGREIVLDEYTKSIEGSDDSYQTFLQLLNGELNEATLENTMKVNGREETYSVTMRAEDFKAGFQVTITGNKEADGHSTHALSRSANSRLSPEVIEDPKPIDWRHRISQILTGLPLTTMFSVFSDMANSEPREFGEMLVDLRQMGLSEEEQNKIPVHQLSMLRNWEKTVEAVNKLSDFYQYWGRLIDPRSDLYDAEKSQNAHNIEKIMDEVSVPYSDECAMDFRKVIQHVADALPIKPKAKTIESGRGLRLNFAAVGQQKAPSETISPELASADMGTRLETVLLERIGTMTAGKPELQKALIKEAAQLGVLSMGVALEESAPKPETIKTLLNQDLLVDFGGTKNVMALQEALAGRMKAADKSLQGKTPAQIIPLDKAAALCREIMDVAANDNSETPRVGKVLTLGNTMGAAFNDVSAIDGAAKENQIQKQASENLVSQDVFLESLKVPVMAEYNLNNIWRKTFSTENVAAENEEIKPIIQMAENSHDSKIGITTIMTRNEAGKASPVHIIADGLRNKTLIVAETIEENTRDEIAAQHGSELVLIARDDIKAEEQIQSFISAVLEAPSRLTEVSALEQELTWAFMLRAGNEQEIESLAKMMARQDLPAEVPVYMVSKQVVPQPGGM